MRGAHGDFVPRWTQPCVSDFRWGTGRLPRPIRRATGNGYPNRHLIGPVASLGGVPWNDGGKHGC